MDDEVNDSDTLSLTKRERDRERKQISRDRNENRNLLLASLLSLTDTHDKLPVEVDLNTWPIRQLYSPAQWKSANTHHFIRPANEKSLVQILHDKGYDGLVKLARSKSCLWIFCMHVRITYSCLCVCLFVCLCVCESLCDVCVHVCVHVFIQTGIGTVIIHESMKPVRLGVGRRRPVWFTWENCFAIHVTR